MRSSWFWKIISFFSFFGLIIFSIRIITYDNAEIPLFTQFMSLYENTDYGFTELFNDFNDYIKDYIKFNDIQLLPLFDDINFDDLPNILLSILKLISNLFATVYNLGNTLIATIALSAVNSVNVIYQITRLASVLIYFTLGVQAP